MTCWKALYWQLAATVSFQLSPQGGGRREEGGDMESPGEHLCSAPGCGAPGHRGPLEDGPRALLYSLSWRAQ